MAFYSDLHLLYERYRASTAFLVTESRQGDEGIGTCFHIGRGVFITARHVVDSRRIVSAGTTEPLYGEAAARGAVETLATAGSASAFHGPFFHPDKSVDLAALILDDLNAPFIPLGGHLDDWINSGLVLTRALVMGYPPIPFSGWPELVAVSGEVNAIIDKYTGGSPHFVLSCMARGGFSGGPVLCHGEGGWLLGVVTESLVLNSGAVESGFMSVLPIEPVYELLVHHCILPREQVTWADELFGDPDTHERNLFEDTELLSNPVPLDRNNDA